MDIKLILKNILKTDTTLDVSGLSLNTKTLKKGDVFVALQGEKTHGIEFIKNAIEKGCVAVLIEGKDVDCDVPTIRIENLNPAYQLLLKTSIPKQKMWNLLQSLEQMARRPLVIIFLSCSISWR